LNPALRKRGLMWDINFAQRPSKEKKGEQKKTMKKEETAGGNAKKASSDQLMMRLSGMDPGSGTGGSPKGKTRVNFSINIGENAVGKSVRSAEEKAGRKIALSRVEGLRSAHVQRKKVGERKNKYTVAVKSLSSNLLVSQPVEGGRKHGNYLRGRHT